MKCELTYSQGATVPKKQYENESVLFSVKVLAEGDQTFDVEEIVKGMKKRVNKVVQERIEEIRTEVAWHELQKEIEEQGKKRDWELEETNNTIAQISQCRTVEELETLTPLIAKMYLKIKKQDNKTRITAELISKKTELGKEKT